MRLKLLPEPLLDLLKEKMYDGDLQKIYKYFIDNFERKWNKSDQGFHNSETKRINSIYREAIRDLNGLIGIDLPTLFESNFASGKLMILAQDPLRSAKDFKHEGKVIIGTPYALHSKFYRDGSSKLYNQLLIRLSAFYKFFYLTDVAKVYAESSNIIGFLKGKDHSEIKEEAHEMLALEIKEIKSNAILAMGNVAKNAIESDKIKRIIEENNILTIYTPHIRAHHNAWINEGAEGSKNENKLKFIVNKIASTKT